MKKKKETMTELLRHRKKALEEHSLKREIIFDGIGKDVDEKPFVLTKYGWLSIPERYMTKRIRIVIETIGKAKKRR
jgi:hypothetical protein